MKPATPLRGLLSYLPSVFATLSLGVAFLGMHGQASAEAVDSELVLLVDVSKSGLNDNKFSSLMDSYASSFTSNEVIGAIQSGTYGRIAVSLMFYGNSAIQQVAIPWMSIGNASDAAQFASIISGISRPLSTQSADVASALNTAVPNFGTETGGVSNGFESTLQIIDIAATTMPEGAGVPEARSAALASGVDMIDAIAVSNNATKASKIAFFFDSFVVGSTLVGPVPATATAAPNAALTAALTLEVTGSLAKGGTTIPEPRTGACLLSAMGFLLLFRRRN